MKKKSTLATVALIALLCIVLSACAQTTNTTASVNEETTEISSFPTAETLVSRSGLDATHAVFTSNTSTDSDAAPASFMELEDDSDEVYEYYRFEVARRIRSGKNFITENEAKWYLDNGYVIGNREGGLILKDNTLYHSYTSYYYPIVVNIRGRDRLIYTYEDGDVLIDPSLSHTNWLGSLHLTYEESRALGENVEFIECTSGYTIIYNPDMEVMQVYQLGHLVESTTARGVYTGKSFWVGYIFRDGSDVYAVRWNDDREEYEAVCIAHHVQYVIDADYALGSDPWSQPLFLMEDGTIKAYLDWKDPEHPDSVENLVDPYYEGGYDR
ncbi:MAG: hypothetical protein IKN74_01935 [Clostridia bacterium]|nr:hypothetical protein [Clostridia bacterium]